MEDNDSFQPATYWESRLRRNYSLHGVGYIGLGTKYNEWLYKMKRNSFLKSVRPLGLNLSHLSILDIGSGTGFWIKQWRELGAGVVSGCDITEVAVEKLEYNYPSCKFYRLDIGENLPATLDQKFDIISAFDVLYHIVDDSRYERAIENIHKLLKDNGLFILADNFIHSQTIRAQTQVNRSLYETENILKNKGFQIIKRTPMFVIMNYPIDSNKLRGFLWNVSMAPVTRSESIGYIFGAILYPIESFLTSVCKESPSTEIMVCKKNSY
jgi:SAM-dependent methyltransferase